MKKTTAQQFIENFSRTICNLTENKTYSTLIFLCAGTDRVTVDAFGPIVGYKLKKLFGDVKNIVILGDLEKTVCNCNIGYWVKIIYDNYTKPFIVSVDSAFSHSNENIGKVIIGKGGIYLGNGLRKEGYIIGDMSIKGIVAKDLGSPRQNFRMLQNVHLNDVIKMADIVANGIFNSIDIK